MQLSLVLGIPSPSISVRVCAWVTSVAKIAKASSSVFMVVVWIKIGFIDIGCIIYNLRFKI